MPYDYETSLAAYVANFEGKKINEVKVLKHIIDSGGRSTIWHIHLATGLPSSSVSGRLNDLIKQKLIYKHPQKEVISGMLRSVFCLVKSEEDIPLIVPKTSCKECKLLSVVADLEKKLADTKNTSEQLEKLLASDKKEVYVTPPGESSSTIQELEEKLLKKERKKKALPPPINNGLF